MAENSTDDNSNGSNESLVDMDDLDNFSDVFYGRTPAPEAKEEVEDLETEDDSLAPSEDTEAEAEDNETEATDNETEAKEDPKPKNRKSAKERIEELVAASRSAERERDAEKAQRELLERRLADFEKRLPAPVVPQTPVAPVAVEVGAPDPNALNANGEPVYPLGEFDPSFVRDLTRFTVGEETKAYEARQRQTQETQRLQAEQATLRQSWEEKVNQVKEELPDYQEQVGKLNQSFGNLDPQYGEYLANTIMQCENGPEIMYYLSQNIGEAQKIVASGPFAATLELGRLQARFEKTGDTGNTPQKVSSAPPPPSERVRGRGGQFSVRPDTDDLDAFEKEFYKRPGR